MKQNFIELWLEVGSVVEVSVSMVVVVGIVVVAVGKIVVAVEPTDSSNISRTL